MCFLTPWDRTALPSPFSHWEVWSFYLFIGRSNCCDAYNLSHSMVDKGFEKNEVPKDLNADITLEPTDGLSDLIGIMSVVDCRRSISRRYRKKVGAVPGTRQLRWFSFLFTRHPPVSQDCY